MDFFNAYMDTNRDFSTWFAKSSTRPIIGDVPMSRGRVLGCITALRWPPGQSGKRVQRPG